jgi:NADH-quinone oxidoreductase subunit L
MEHAAVEAVRGIEGMTEVGYLWLIPVLPLIGAFINGVFGAHIQKRFGIRPIHTLAVGVMVVSCLIAWISFFKLATLPAEGRALYDHVFRMLHVGSLKADMAFYLDPLSMTMTLIVTTISALIHVYSIGYMHGEKSYWRFFSYLNLFVFAMLLLVMSDNFVAMFFGWEGVGLCSYLLIGFWYTDVEKAKAGMKAFIVNRFGDFGFLAGLLLLFWGLGGAWALQGAWSGTEYTADAGQPTMVFRELAHRVDLLQGKEVWGVGLITLVCILFFVGATGKSAQIPLYIWLPDAMAGPTPVSALIHAATMVTAGVYMVARLNFLFALSPVAMTVVATVGALTALFAATIGLFQYDIKKVLAYSTVSQLGFMFIGVGVGAYWVGIFHLLTHACFKGALFLCSGSVIHGMGGEQDMRKMGGLGKLMPQTYRTYLLATAAIAGFPFFSGFFSKDEILWKAFDNGNTLIPGPILWFIGAVAAACTSFYMFRSVYMTFSGENRADEETKHHIHESPATMTGVLWALGIASAGIGVIGLPHLWHLPNFFEHWLDPVMVGSHHLVKSAGFSHGTEWALMLTSVAIAFGGWYLARLLYKDARSPVPRQMLERFPQIHRVIFNKYYIDELYNATVIAGSMKLMNILRAFDDLVVDGLVNLVGLLSRIASYISGAIDKYLVDGAVDFLARIILGLGQRMRSLQTGRLQSYLYGALGGTLVFVALNYLLF